MSTEKGMFCFLSLFLLAAVVTAEAPKYVLSQYCNATIPVDTAALLKVDNWFLSENTECQVTIRSKHSIYRDNLVRLQILHFDADCYSNSLLLYDGPRTTGRKIATLCGGLSSDQKMYLTLASELTLVVTRQDYQASPLTLRLLATSTSRQYSGESDFVCNNDLNIANSLCCDGYNNCGDWSDEREAHCTNPHHHGFHWSRHHTYIAIGAGVGLLLIVVVVVVLVKRRHRRRKAKKARCGLAGIESSPAYGTIQGIENPGLVPPPAYQQSPDDVMTTPSSSKAASA